MEPLSKKNQKITLIIVLDACRTILTSSFKPLYLSNKETSIFKKNQQFVLIYATESGKESYSNRKEELSIFTNVFVHYLKKDLEIIEIVKCTNLSMQFLQSDQLPWINHRLYEDIFLHK